MRFLLLKFCYAVEIGAYLAYVGHYKASKDSVIKSIKRDELVHMVNIRKVLVCYSHAPNLVFNLAFFMIGSIIKVLCSVTPLVLLDGVAQIMEVFNIISYDLMAKLFPEHKEIFNDMEESEREHEIYLSTFPKYGRL